MADKAVLKLLVTLSNERFHESPESNALRQKAISIITQLGKDTTDITTANHDLLTSVVKPLFLASKHPALSTTGRKNLVSPLPSITETRGSLFDEASKPWKNGWTVDIIRQVISSYAFLPDDQRKGVFESQFFLLTPPILNMIDDFDNSYKICGFQMLDLLCQEVQANQSEILKRSGLVDVFRDALKPNFMLLPTLTPEEESIAIMKALYPAYSSLVAAVCQPDAPPPPNTNINSNIKSQTYPRSKPSPTTSIKSSKISPPHVTLLNPVLRHTIHTALPHSFPDHPRLTTLLLRYLIPILSTVGIYAVVHLQTLLPLLRHILSNPFGGTTQPDQILAALELLQRTIQVCWPRVRERWWVECLRGVVGAWLVLMDDHGDRDDVEAAKLKRKMQELVELIAAVAEQDEFQSARDTLIADEESLRDLFVLSVPEKTK